jgi:hypothetical protein
VLAWGKTDATLLGSENQEPAPFQDFVYNVDGDGVYLAQTVAANLTGGGDQIHSDFGTGLIYSDNGNVADPTSGKIVGTFNASGLAMPDSSLNRVFFLSQSQSQVNTNSSDDLRQGVDDSTEQSCRGPIFHGSLWSEWTRNSHRYQWPGRNALSHFGRWLCDECDAFAGKRVCQRGSHPRIPVTLEASIEAANPSAGASQTYTAHNITAMMP